MDRGRGDIDEKTQQEESKLREEKGESASYI